MVEKSLSGLLLLFCLGYLLIAKDLQFGSLKSPSLGFIPMIAGSAAAVIAVFLFIKEFRTKNGKAGKVQFDAASVKQIAMYTAGLIAYLILLKIAGFLIATFVVLIYLLKVTRVNGWVSPVLISVGVSAGFYWVFAILLSVPLP